MSRSPLIQEAIGVAGAKKNRAETTAGPSGVLTELEQLFVALADDYVALERQNAALHLKVKKMETEVSNSRLETEQTYKRDQPVWVFLIGADDWKMGVIWSAYGAGCKVATGGGQTFDVWNAALKPRDPKLEGKDKPNETCSG